MNHIQWFYSTSVNQMMALCCHVWMYDSAIVRLVNPLVNNMVINAREQTSNYSDNRFYLICLISMSSEHPLWITHNLVKWGRFQKCAVKMNAFAPVVLQTDLGQGFKFQSVFVLNTSWIWVTDFRTIQIFHILFPCLYCTLFSDCLTEWHLWVIVQCRVLQPSASHIQNVLKISSKYCLTQVGFNNDLLGIISKFTIMPALNDRNQHQQWPRISA